MQKHYVLLMAIIITSLTGCSKNIVSEVTRFHSLPAPNLETIEVIPLDDNLRKSLEFGQYAELVGQYLGRHGYKPPSHSPSQLIARIGYLARPANDGMDSGPRSSVGIGIGSGGRRSSVGVGISIPLGQDKIPQDKIRRLTLEIIQRSDGIKLYEGQVTSRGKENMPLIMPYLVDALFTDFPGENGASNTVKITP